MQDRSMMPTQTRQSRSSKREVKKRTFQEATLRPLHPRRHDDPTAIPFRPRHTRPRLDAERSTGRNVGRPRRGDNADEIVEINVRCLFDDQAFRLFRSHRGE